MAYKYFDTRSRYCLGSLKEGTMLGDREVIFDCSPIYHIESVSYCTIGCISKENFIEFLDSYPIMKKAMTDRII